MVLEERFGYRICGQIVNYSKIMFRYSLSQYVPYLQMLIIEYEVKVVDGFHYVPFIYDPYVANF